MPVTNDILQVRIWCKMGDQASVNVRHYLITAHVGNGPTLAQIATTLDGAYGTPIKDCLVDTASYQGVQVQRVWPFPPTVAATASANFGTGATPGPPLPKQVAGLIGWSTPFAGRKYRGRTYVPFPPATFNDASGKPVVGYVSSLNLLRTALLTERISGVNPDTATLSPGLPGKTLVIDSDPPRYVLNGTFVLITAGAGKTIWATQRRRGDYGRKNVSPFG